MGLFGMMRTSTSGMAAQENLLASVSDNVANSSTTGYKRSTQEFSTIVLENSVAAYQSGAVESTTRTIATQQGALNYTSSSTDLAISGSGFFVVEDASGAASLTRAGSFVKDGQGNLVNAAGDTLLGYPSTVGTTPVANGFAGLVPVNLASLPLKADASTQGRFYVNLPAMIDPVAGPLPSANAASSSTTRLSSIVAYDNIGAPVTLDVYQSKVAGNTWEITVFNRADAASGGNFPYSTGPLATTTLSFDPATGALALASPGVVSVPIPNGSSLDLDVSKTTELPTDFSVRDVKMNGSAPSVVDRVEIGRDGDVVAVYKNGLRASVFQIPLATVVSPENLLSLPGNKFGVTRESGALIMGLPGADGLGQTISGALEKSTVDVATELTVMIEAQYGYTANSKVFQTSTELMEVLINLKR
jgi:flagellar hook protein FlgE